MIGLRVTLNPEKYQFDRKKILSKVEFLQRELETQFYKNLKDVIKKRMRHTTKHGWNYQYTGQLYRSFYTKERKMDKEKLRAAILVSSWHPAARILEFGGKITPRQRSLLTVPLSSASQYGFTVETIQQLLKSRKVHRIGNKLYVSIAGAKIPIVVLKASVYIPPYNYVSLALKHTLRKVTKLR